MNEAPRIFDTPDNRDDRKKGWGRRWRRYLPVGGAALAALLLILWLTLGLHDTRPPLLGDLPPVDPAPDTGWSDWGNTPEGVRFSPLTQIDTGNIRHLERAWVARTGEAAELDSEVLRQTSFQATPILTPASASQLLVLCTPMNRVIALDPATGAERWRFDPRIARASESPRSCRGVAYWEDAALPAGAVCRHRIFTGTQDLRLFALDARTGRPCPGWGQDGAVKVHIGGTATRPGEVQFKAPPIVLDGVVVIGSTIRDSLRTDGPHGTIHGFDARSGDLRWRFDPIPRDPSDPLRRDWGGDSADRSGGANAWGTMAADPARGLIFVPTGSAQVDHYGGNRPGDNRWSDSLLAIRAATGKLAWGYQMVHHDLWDLDIAAQPILTELEVDGRRRDVVIQTTKMGLTFVLDRDTGEPVFPTPEVSVSTAGVPGERLAPTQPIPTSPPPLQPITLGPEDAWGLTPLDRRACARKIAAAPRAGLYAPPTLEGTALMPMSVGGVNWGGAAFDPRAGILYVNTSRVPGWLRLIPREQAARADSGIGSDVGTFLAPQGGTPYVAELSLLASPLGLPCTAPPWGELSALDLRRGKLLWQVPFGTLAGQAGLGIRTGLPSMGGPIITAGGLLFISATMDERFRAYDMKTGAELWRDKLPAGSHTVPITYAVGGRQYVVVTAGGHFGLDTRRGDYVVAYALPADAVMRR